MRCHEPADDGTKAGDPFPCPFQFKSLKNLHTEAWQDPGARRDTNLHTATQTPTLFTVALVFRSTSGFALGNAGIE